jgi:hypothetical protein
MQDEYDENQDDPAKMSDEELFFHHVIQEDHDLMTIDILLSNAFSQVKD